MAAEWYYVKNKQRVGPVPFERLKQLASSGQLLPTDMVWQQGMAKWTPASSVDGLFPPTVQVMTPPPLPEESTGLKGVWERLYRNKPAFFGIALLVAFVFGQIVSPVGDLLPDGLAILFGLLYLLLLAGLFGAFVVFLFQSLVRSLTKDAQRILLWGKWEPVEPNTPSVEFTNEGAFIRGDGKAGKYTFTGELVSIDIDGQPNETLKLLTVTEHELVFSVNGAARTYRKGQTYTEMQAKRPSETPATGQSGGPTRDKPAAAARHAPGSVAAGGHAPTGSAGRAAGAAGHETGSAPAYCDCPDCGAPIDITGLPTDKTIACPSCSFNFACRDGLNQRSTPHAEEKRGWFGQVLWGSSLQKSRKAKYDQMISQLKWLIHEATRQGNYTKAQFHQMQLNQLAQDYEW